MSEPEYEVVWNGVRDGRGGDLLVDTLIRKRRNQPPPPAPKPVQTPAPRSFAPVTLSRAQASFNAVVTALHMQPADFLSVRDVSLLAQRSMPCVRLVLAELRRRGQLETTPGQKSHPRGNPPTLFRLRMGRAS